MAHGIQGGKTSLSVRSAEQSSLAPPSLAPRARGKQGNAETAIGACKVAMWLI
eukprot:CAMPEP_0183357832 /NCGR_PEP_ID=MMETSP0164_2-20130417/47514_1 /TAXON_ID=221442 /ORGANISM="Coccolithus pelagicus ssp braarudi, Strain PLY182g" /LENGTH=52 /DNA_ID=CAMNT_0025531565 /DNA_START=242 /DNA_END=400 /DNA_ORIENTATION=+